MSKQKNTKKNSKKKNQNFDSSSFPQFSQCPNNVPKPLQQNYIKQSQIHKKLGQLDSNFQILPKPNKGFERETWNYLSFGVWLNTAVGYLELC
jgi:hypothetical protein